MVFAIDDIVFENVSVSKLKRTVKITNGRNGGTFLNGKKYYDTKKSYINYDMVINASTLSPVEYDMLFDLMAQPQETHFLQIVYGQKMLQIEAHIDSINDSCLKIFPDHTLWGNLTVSFSSSEALDV